jgi:hypothetical protein
MNEDHKAQKTLAEILAALHDTNHLLHEVVRELREVEKELRPLPPAALRITAAILPDGTVGRIPMDVTLSNPLQSVTDTVSAVDANGNTVPNVTYDAPPQWTISDTTIATIAPAADGLSAVVTGVAAGSVLVTVSASVGGVALTPGTQTVTVTTATVGAPVALVITPGTPA